MDLTTEQDVSIRLEALKLALMYSQQGGDVLDNALRFFEFLTVEDPSEVQG